MEYFDEEILEARMEIERLMHTTLETGIYVGDELYTFSTITIPNTRIKLCLPEQFIIMPEAVKKAKYPSLDAPEFIITSLDSMVNIGFNVLDSDIEKGDTEEMSNQFQRAIKNINPSITINKRQGNEFTEQGYEMSKFEFKGYTIDGQNYNWMYLIRMRSNVLHIIANCPMQYKDEWGDIVSKCVGSMVEDI